MPSAFISYSWDPEPHPTWVRELSVRLRADGIETILDQWHAHPAINLPQFMETAIRDNDFVIVICTPKYKRKADNREGGVGYEGDVMTGETFVLKNRRKFIPVLREGEWHASAPSWLLGSYYVDLRGEDWEARYSLLLNTLYNRLPEPPPVQAQGFRVLPDKSILDTKSELVWTNCRDVKLVELEDVQPLIQKLGEESGWQWRLPTDDEIDAVKEVEEYYPRAPIMVEIDRFHPFFGHFKKSPWTQTIISKVRKSDIARASPGYNPAAGSSGLASALNVDPYQVASELHSLGRMFLLRLVRQASKEDLKSSIVT